MFLDPFRPGVENPLPGALAAVPDAEAKAVIDLGCGTGPLLPLLVERFGEVIALDFAPGMIARRPRTPRARRRPASTFHDRPMDDLDDLAGQFDVAVAINSLVMPDVRAIDRTLARHPRAPEARRRVPGRRAVDRRHPLPHDAPDGPGAGPAGSTPEEAERLAAYHAEHRYYEFAFGRFQFQGLRQKFWQPFEIEYRLKQGRVLLGRARPRALSLGRHIAGGAEFADHPRSWDWSFTARP